MDCRSVDLSGGHARVTACPRVIWLPKLHCHLFMSGWILGTMWWLAPENLRSSRKRGERERDRWGAQGKG